MPKIISALTDTAIRLEKPANKPKRLFDGKVVGLHLLIQPNGSKLWRLRYTFAGKEKRVALGDYSTYPELSLADARQRAEDMLVQVRKGIDPSAPIIAPEVITFEKASEKFVFWKENECKIAPATIRKYRECLNNDLLPKFGHRDIATLAPVEVVPVLEKINERSNSLAIKNVELVGMIIKYSIQKGWRPPYTNFDLSGLIKVKARTPKVIPTNLPVIFQSVEQYSNFVMRTAMQMQFLFWLRSSETMGARWEEIDFKKREWHVAKERMKMKRPHVVPLPTQAVVILKKLKEVTGYSPFLFPSPFVADAHLHRDSLSKAFREHNCIIQPHGMRTAANTWLKDKGFAPHVVRLQMSHVSKDKIGNSYLDKPWLMYLKERHVLMQSWADYLHSPSQNNP